MGQERNEIRMKQEWVIMDTTLRSGDPPKNAPKLVIFFSYLQNWKSAGILNIPQFDIWY
jgi:hypothetical protein